MEKLRLPKSVRKFIRLEKARIRTQFFDLKKQEEIMTELYKKFFYNQVAERDMEKKQKMDVKSKIKKQKEKIQIKNKRKNEK